MTLEDLERRLRRLERHFYIYPPNEAERSSIVQEFLEEDGTMYVPKLDKPSTTRLLSEVATLFPPPEPEADESGDK